MQVRKDIRGSYLIEAQGRSAPRKDTQTRIAIVRPFNRTPTRDLTLYSDERTRTSLAARHTLPTAANFQRRVPRT